MMIILILLILALALTLGAMLSCQMEPKDKDFEVENLSITLTNEFKEISASGQTKAFESEQIVALFLKESFERFEQDHTALEYAQMVQKSNAIENSQITESDDGYVEFSYQSGKYSYYARCYKTADAYWLIRFATSAQNDEETAKALDEKIKDFAASIEFER